MDAVSTTTDELFVLLACVAAAVVTVAIGTLVEYTQRRRLPICRVRIRRRRVAPAEHAVNEPSSAMLARIESAVDSELKAEPPKRPTLRIVGGDSAAVERKPMRRAA